MKTPTHRITLTYTCPECNATETQRLAIIVKSGTAVCPDCDRDMLLDKTVTVELETMVTPRVLIIVSGGVAGVLSDGDVSIELIDYDNTPDATVSPEFANLLPKGNTP